MGTAQVKSSPACKGLLHLGPEEGAIVAVDTKAKIMDQNHSKSKTTQSQTQRHLPRAAILFTLRHGEPSPTQALDC